MDFLLFFMEIKTFDFWLAGFFREIFKIHRQVWIFIVIFGCFVSISSIFHFDLVNYSLY